MAVIGAMLCIVCVAGPTRGQSTDQIAGLACRSALMHELRGTMPDVDSVRVAQDPLVWRKANRRTAVEGYGQFQDRRSRAWQHFIYDCTYNSRSGDARVTVKQP
jgi:hypothetical protein